MNKKYYIEYCPYGTRTMSDSNSLYAFTNKAERDQFASDNWEYWQACSAKEARSWYGVNEMKLAQNPTW